MKPPCRYEIKLKQLTDPRSISLISVINSNLERSETHLTFSRTTFKRTFLLGQEQEGIQEESMKAVTFMRTVSLENIQLVLSILSCVFSFLVVYTDNVDELFLYNSISASTLVTMIVLVCRFIVADKTFGFGQLIQILVYAIHPNILTTNINGFLHVALMCRAHIAFKCFLRSRVYLNNRTDRVVEANGSSPSGMVFAIKAELRQMDSKSLLFVYGLIVAMLSHCLYVTLIFDAVTSVTFVDCLFLMAQTMTLIGFSYTYESTGARLIAIMALIIGQCLNGTMILINVRSLTMKRQESQAHEFHRYLIQREQVQKSAVKIIEFNHLHKHNPSMNHPSEYHKIALDIRSRRKNLYQTSRGGVVENLAMNFMESCSQMGKKSRLTFNYLHRVIHVLNKSGERIPKSVRFIDQSQQRKVIEEQSVAQEQEVTFQPKKKERRTIRNPAMKLQS